MFHIVFFRIYRFILIDVFILQEDIRAERKRMRLMNRDKWQNKMKEEFLGTYKCVWSGCENKRLKATSEDLLQWIKFKSWIYCKHCQLLHNSKLLPNYFKSTIKEPVDCPCKKDTYTVPQINSHPSELLQLSSKDQDILRLFDMDLGPYKVEK